MLNALLLCMLALLTACGGGDDHQQPDRDTDPVQCGPVGNPGPCL